MEVPSKSSGFGKHWIDEIRLRSTRSNHGITVITFAHDGKTHSNRNPNIPNRTTHTDFTSTPLIDLLHKRRGRRRGNIDVLNACTIKFTDAVIRKKVNQVRVLMLNIAKC